MRGARSTRAGVLSLALLVASFVGAPRQDDGAKDEPPIHRRIDLPSLTACGGCHLEVVREWSRSLHARAWTNTNVRRATNDFTKKSCRPCHSPQPVLVSGLDRAPDYRDFNREDGVHCLSCHGLEDGVAATRTIPDAPCKPLEDPRLRTAALCYPCHEPTHGAFAEYDRSQAKAAGKTCADCHMPTHLSPSRAARPGEAADAPRLLGVDHGPNGGMNAAFVRGAIAWSARWDDTAPSPRFLVEVTNRTGHRFPGEIPSRAFLVEVRFDGAEWESILLRKPHKDEDRQDDRLDVDETRTLRFGAPDGARSAEVRLLFQPLPLLPREDCIVLGEQVVER